MQGLPLSRLLLDAGGSRSISQLKILEELMHRLNYDEESDDMSRPCDVFDMICGVGSGGYVLRTAMRTSESMTYLNLDSSLFFSPCLD